MRKSLALSFGFFLTSTLACTDDGGQTETSSTETSSTGDGDGDPATGDGDGDPTGDGDGDPTGDGDGDPTGDGDGDPTGDGDGDPTGDGDGDPECIEPGEVGALDHTPLDQPISEFYGESGFASILTSQEDYNLYFAGQAPADFETEWLIFVHPGRTSIGTSHSFAGIDVDGACSLSVAHATSTLGETCETFETLTRPDPLLARSAIAFDPPTTPELVPAPGQPFDCEGNGAGEFEDCTEASWCAPGLICAGITRFDTGMCMDADLRGVFAAEDLGSAFTNAEPLVTNIDADGLATVDMDVILNLVLDHPDPSALTITLTNPSGNEVMVWDQEPSPYDFAWYPEPGTLRLSRVPVGFSGDEDVNGTWELRITSTSDDPGTLDAYALEVMSRFD